jgi:hypothetical protein
MEEAWVEPDLTFSYSRIKPNDFVGWMPGAPVVSDAARTLLHGIVGAGVEFLPLFTRRGKPFFAMNVLETTSSLDKSSSRIEYFDEDEREIMMVRTAVFDFGAERIPPAFKIEGYSGDVYVSREFALAVRNAGLTGAMFLDPRKDILSRAIRNQVNDDFEQ